jgi:hypothetical protein
MKRPVPLPLTVKTWLETIVSTAGQLFVLLLLLFCDKRLRINLHSCTTYIDCAVNTNCFRSFNPVVMLATLRTFQRTKIRNRNLASLGAL